MSPMRYYVYYKSICLLQEHIFATKDGLFCMNRSLLSDLYRSLFRGAEGH